MIYLNQVKTGVSPLIISDRWNLYRTEKYILRSFVQLQLARTSWRHFKQEGNQVTKIEELANEMNLSSSAYSIIRDQVLFMLYATCFCMKQPASLAFALASNLYKQYSFFTNKNC